MLMYLMHSGFVNLLVKHCVHDEYKNTEFDESHEGSFAICSRNKILGYLCNIINATRTHSWCKGATGL